MLLTWFAMCVACSVGATEYTTGEVRTSPIRLKQGYVRGRIVRPKRNLYLEEVDVYLGIPYAAPPIGSLRFMPPGSALPWKGTLDAVTPSAVCPQALPDLNEEYQSKMPTERTSFIKRMMRYLKTENEDCLYLNIYVPRTGNVKRENDRFPVIMFIHGESFEWNSGNLYDGSVISSFGKVIFVSINFRLGIFGFLNPDFNSKNTINFGLLDQIAALRWIKDNIEHFGGDASRVTIMGHGTGAACANFLMLAPPAADLFHRTILMSGTALSDGALMQNTILQTLQVAEHLNCAHDNMRYCLEHRRKEDIMAVKFDSIPFRSVFSPVVDEITVLNSPAEHMWKHKDLFSRYDLLMGVTELESYYMVEDAYLKFGMNSEEGLKVMEMFSRAQYEKFVELVTPIIFEKYMVRQHFPSVIEIKNAVLEALSDAIVVAPAIQTIKYHSAVNRNSYFYVFSHRTYSENYIKTDKSVYGDELPYVLGVPLDGPFFQYQSDYNISEARLSESVMRYWTNFAKTGNPNTDSSPRKRSAHSPLDWRQYTIKWDSYNLAKQPYLQLGIPPKLRHKYRDDFEQFWNLVVPNIIKNYSGNLPNYDMERKPLYDISSDDNGPTYLLPFTQPPMIDFSKYTNFSKWPTVVENDTVPQESSASSWLVTLGVIFLVVNICAFGAIYHQRDKLKLRERFFNARFHSQNARDIPSMYDVEGSLNIDNLECSSQNIGDDNDDSEDDNNEDDKRVEVKMASVMPEAMTGKRMKRWPLSRQCSGSTITVDAHTKVKEWIAQEIVPKCSPRLFKKRKERPEEAQKTATKTQTLSRTNTNEEKSRKISVAIDATPAARTGSVLKQIPIEVTKSLDGGKLPMGSGVIRSSASLSCISKMPRLTRCALASEESDILSTSARSNVVHQSQATIRLKTPAPSRTLPIAHSHSKSDPCEMIKPLRDDREDFNRGGYFSGQSSSKVDSFESSYYYDDINVNSCVDIPEQIDTSQGEALNNIKKRNYPKVLPDLPSPRQISSNKRLSLPAVRTNVPSIQGQEGYQCKNKPQPPPRLVSTLTRNHTPIPELKHSHLTVHLRKPEPGLPTTVIHSESEPDNRPSKKREPKIIIKASTSGAPIHSDKKVSTIPRVVRQSSQDSPVSCKRSVCTSTTAIPKVTPDKPNRTDD